MATILAITETLLLGGGNRAFITGASYSSQSSGHRYQILSLSPTLDDPAACEFAERHGVQVVRADSDEELNGLISSADIVLLNWWSSPDMGKFMLRHLAPCRLAAWLHVGGHSDPQRVPDHFVDYVDLAIACSPYTAECDAFTNLSVETRLEKTAMVYAPADVKRLAWYRPIPHQGFNIGYIGTVHPLKMHEHYVRMSAAVKVPKSRFLVYGSGGYQPVLQAQAKQLGVEDRFVFNNTTDDIAHAIGLFDVYGYPLCEDTYAACELNLQEVMHCGVVPVVFPHGGCKRLIVDNFTGFLVKSEREYAQAVEFLYHHPEERQRMGRNAAEYARQIFAPEISGAGLNALWDDLLQKPKTAKAPLQPTLKIPTSERSSGIVQFLETLGPTRALFQASLATGDYAPLFDADAKIMNLSVLLKHGGILRYAAAYPSDPYLCFWAGLVLQSEQTRLNDACIRFIEAIEFGFPHWRPWWYLAQIALSLGDLRVAKQALDQLVRVAPSFSQGRSAHAELLQRVG